MERIMSIQAPKEVSFQLIAYEQTWIDSLNRGDVAAADEVFTADCVIHINGGNAPDLNVAAFKEMINGFIVAFPDLQFTIEDQLIDGDKVAMRWVATGTHTGPLGDIPPTGKQAIITGLALDHITDGQVSERWEQWDQSSLLHQLGLL